MLPSESNPPGIGIEPPPLSEGQKEIIRRLLGKYDVDTNGDGCWEWTRRKFRGGYGAVREHDKMRTASRWISEIAYGYMPRDIFVCHRCDNRACVNPSHFFFGTSQDNASDAVFKGRTLKKKRTRRDPGTVSNRKLSDYQVISLRNEAEDGASTKDLAERYGISVSNVRRIVTRSTWGFLECAQ